MNLVNELSDEQIRLLKEADVVVEDRNYTEDECRYIVGKVMEYIMSFSKKDISNVANRYEEILYGLYLQYEVTKGIKDMENGNEKTSNEVKEIIKKW